MSEWKRRETDKSLLRQFTPADWIKIIVLAGGLIGSWVGFDYRIGILERDHRQFMTTESIQTMHAATRQVLEERIAGNRDGSMAQFNELRSRLDRIEKKIDRGR